MIAEYFKLLYQKKTAGRRTEKWLRALRFSKGDILIATNENYLVVEPVKNVRCLEVGNFAEVLEDQGNNYLISVHCPASGLTGTVIAAHFKFFAHERKRPPWNLSTRAQ